MELWLILLFEALQLKSQLRVNVVLELRLALFTYIHYSQFYLSILPFLGIKDLLFLLLLVL